MATKRGADFQMSKEGAFNGDGSESSDQSNRASKASSAQLAKRKIAQARRPGGGSARSTIKPPIPPQAQGTGAFAVPNSELSSINMNGNTFQQNGAGLDFSAPSGIFSFGQTNATQASNLLSGPGSFGVSNNPSAGNFGQTVTFGGQNGDTVTPNSSFTFGAPAGATFSFGNQISTQNTGGYQGTLFNLTGASSALQSPSTSPRRSPSPSKGGARKRRQSNNNVEDTAPQWASSSPFHRNHDHSDTGQMAPSSLTNGFVTQGDRSNSQQNGIFGASNLNPFASPPKNNLFGFNQRSEPQVSPAVSQPPFVISQSTFTSKQNTVLPLNSQATTSSEDSFMASTSSTGSHKGSKQGNESNTPLSNSTPSKLNFGFTPPQSTTPTNPPLFSTKATSPPGNTTSSFLFAQPLKPTNTNSSPFTFGGRTVTEFSPSVSQTAITTKLSPKPAPNVDLSLTSLTSDTFKPKTQIATHQTVPSTTESLTAFIPKAQPQILQASQSQTSASNLFASTNKPTMKTSAAVSSTMGLPPLNASSQIGNSTSTASETFSPSKLSTAGISTISPQANQTLKLKPGPLFNSGITNKGSIINTQSNNTGGGKTDTISNMNASEVSSNGIDVDELKSIKARCLSMIPTIPDGFSEPQKDELIFAYRMMCLEKGLLGFVESLLGKNAELKQASYYYDIARSVVFQAAGVKRKATNAGLDQRETSNKRTNLSGPVVNDPGSPATHFGLTNASNRVFSDEQTSSFKKPSVDDVSNPGMASSSQTSQIFANLTSSPSKGGNSANSLHLTGSLQKTQTSGNIFGRPKDSFSSTPSASLTTNTVFGTAKSNISETTSTISHPTPSESSVGHQIPHLVTHTSPTPHNFNFLAQFSDNAKKFEEERKERAKDEEWEEDEETEAEWERRWEERQKDSKELVTLSNIPKFTVDSGKNFLAQFGKTASDMAEEKARKSKEERKVEEMDSDSDEAEWERQDAVKQRLQKEECDTLGRSENLKFKVQGASPAFSGTSSASIFSNIGPASRTPTPSIFENHSRADSDAEGSKTGDADNEESDEDGESRDNNNEEKRSSSAEKPAQRSLFDRIDRDENGNPIKDLSVSADRSANINTLGNAASSQTKLSLASTLDFANPSGDHTWKPESPIKFATVSTTSAPNVGVTSPSPSNTPAGDSKTASVFGNLFGTPQASSTPASNPNPFAHLSNSNIGLNSTPQPRGSVGGNLVHKSILDSATTSRGTSPGMTTAEESTGEGGDETAPGDPQLDLSESRAGEEDEEVLFALRAKGLELDSPTPGEPKQWITRGVGEFRLLQNRETKRCRMVLRAGPAAKVVLNTGLLVNATYILEATKNVQFPVPKEGGITKWTIRFGSGTDAARLHGLLEKHSNHEISS